MMKSAVQSMIPNGSTGTKRIALFTRHLTMGGVQRIMVQLANGFEQRGLAVDLVLAKGGGSMTRHVNPGVRLIDLGSNREWTALPALVRYLRTARPDALLSAGVPSNIVATWSKALAPSDMRLLLSVHQNTSQHIETSTMWYTPLFPFLIRTFYPLADHVVTVSTGIKEDLRTVAPRAEAKASVIYNPVVDATIAQKASGPAPHPWLADPAIPVVLAVGRLVPAKNFELLIRAFSQVAAEREARLLFLGEGNRRAALEALVRERGLEDRVELHPFVANPYVYMAHADVLAMSSVFEGLPTVLIEALACGCPVVSTDCPDGPREILEGGRWGRLVPMDDEAALARAILATLAEPHDPERLRQRAQHFSVERSIDRYLEMLFPGDTERSAPPVCSAHASPHQTKHTQ